MPILKSLSAGWLKNYRLLLQWLSAVAAVAELCLCSGKEKTKNRTTELFFFQYERQKQKVSSKATQRFFVTNETRSSAKTDEVGRRGVQCVEVCKNRFHSSLYESESSRSSVYSESAPEHFPFEPFQGICIDA